MILEQKTCSIFLTIACVLAGSRCNSWAWRDYLNIVALKLILSWSGLIPLLFFQVYAL